MNYDEFIGRVQNRARLASTGEAVRATRATLEVLGQRLFGGEADDLAAQLPQELQAYLRQAKPSESFDLGEFHRRVTEAEGVEYPEVVFHARAVMSVLQDAVTRGEMNDVRAQLPDDYNDLFEFEFEMPGPERRTRS
jgi:uncharacterized protein (DUF2267 family)